MATYLLNTDAVDFVEELISKRRYVLQSTWTEANPDAETENAFLERHDWVAYGRWHLGLTEGASEETKGRFAFCVGDFSRVHLSLIHISEPTRPY